MKQVELDTDGSNIPKDLQKRLAEINIEVFFLKSEMEFGEFTVEEIRERLSGVFDPGKWCDLQENKQKKETVELFGGIL